MLNDILSPQKGRDATPDIMNQRSHLRTVQKGAENQKLLLQARGDTSHKREISKISLAPHTLSSGKKSSDKSSSGKGSKKHLRSGPSSGSKFSRRRYKGSHKKSGSSSKSSFIANSQILLVSAIKEYEGNSNQ